MANTIFEYKGRLIQLPVLPEELPIERRANSTSYDLVGQGETNVYGKQRLKVFKIESFLPEYDNAPYVTTKGEFKPPIFYIDFFNTVMQGQEPMRMIVTDYNINLLVDIDEFKTNYVGGTGDVDYILELVEARVPTVKTVKPNVVSPTAPPQVTTQTRPKTGFAVGDNVLVNGKYWYDSYGSPPNGTFNNFAGVIHKIVSDTKRAYRYHITTPDGKWRGWVAESQLKHR